MPKRWGAGTISLRDVIAAVFRHRASLHHALAVALSWAGMFAYVSGSPFVFMEVFGDSEPVSGTKRDPSHAVRQRLLDTAERLFGENGVAETSVRAITTTAALNLALVNYHFGSKENLVRAVVERRQGTLNAERLRLLDSVGATPAVSRTRDLDAILYAFGAPAVQLAIEHPYCARLISRLRLDPDQSLWRDYRDRQFEIISRFRTEMAAALPHLDDAELMARLHFLRGAIQQIWAHSPLPPDEEPGVLLTRFLAFYTAAFRAPATIPDKASLATSASTEQRRSCG